MTTRFLYILAGMVALIGGFQGAVTLWVLRDYNELAVVGHFEYHHAKAAHQELIEEIDAGNESWKRVFQDARRGALEDQVRWEGRLLLVTLSPTEYDELVKRVSEEIRSGSLEFSTLPIGVVKKIGDDGWCVQQVDYLTGEQTSIEADELLTRWGTMKSTRDGAVTYGVPLFVCRAYLDPERPDDD